MWSQVYDPLGIPALSTVVAALPVVVRLGALGVLRMRAHLAALLGLAAALVIAVLVFGMPASTALATAGFGAAYGLFPIGWIILNVLFLYQLTQDRGLFMMLARARATLGPVGSSPSAARSPSDGSSVTGPRRSASMPAVRPVPLVNAVGSGFLDSIRVVRPFTVIKAAETAMARQQVVSTRPQTDFLVPEF